MFGSFILDVVVGMVFIYLLLSLVASGVNEILASLVQSRAANLERGLRSLLSGDSIAAGTLTLVDNLYDHGLIRGLYPDPELDLRQRDSSGKILDVRIELSWWSKLRLWLQKRVGIAPSLAIEGIKNPLLLPSYIPSRTFALAMIDILNKDKFNNNKTAIENIEDFLKSHHQQFAQNKAVEAFLTLLIDAKNDAEKDYQKLQKFQANLENWYNDAMDRVSGWYKRYTQRVLLTVGLVLAIAFNVNSIRIAHLLWVDHDVRTGMANAASDYWSKHQTAAPHASAPATKTSADKGAGQTQTSDQKFTDQQVQPAAGQGANQNANSSANQAGVVPGTGSATPNTGKTETQTQTDADAKQSITQLAAQLNSSVQAFHEVSNKYLLPVGWHTQAEYSEWWRENRGDMILSIPVTLVGWLITAGALSLGASFWFDMLNKIMVVRNTVKPQEKSVPEPSKDR